MSEITHTVSADYAGSRVDSWLFEQTLFPSRSAAAKALDQGLVAINGVTVAKNQKLKANDVVTFIVEPRHDITLDPIALPLKIYFEDEHIIVLSKPAGLSTHPAESCKEPTLVNALIAHCGRENLFANPDEPLRPGIVHRLDKGTSGLMLAAKSAAAGFALQEAFKAHTIERHYKALVYGIIDEESGYIDAPICRSLSDRKKMAIRDGASARDAITSFSVLQRYPGTKNTCGYTLIDCKLFTGRTHQIRVHMEYIGHPVVGDDVYTNGAKGAATNFTLTRQFLHSYRLNFVHPVTGESLSFVDELEDDLAQVLRIIEA